MNSEKIMAHSDAKGVSIPGETEVAGGARQSLIALYQVGRNLHEITEYGRILTEGERREIPRLEKLADDTFQAGWDCAVAGGKQKANPHPGGEPLWWAWHEGYKAAKKADADARRTATTASAVGTKPQSGVVTPTPRSQYNG